MKMKCKFCGKEANFQVIREWVCGKDRVKALNGELCPAEFLPDVAEPGEYEE